MRRSTVVLRRFYAGSTIVMLALLLAAQLAARELVVVTIETSLGSIDVEIDARHAPITAANFLRYVDAKMSDGGRFHRAVRLDNQAARTVERRHNGALPSARI